MLSVNFNFNKNNCIKILIVLFIILSSIVQKTKSKFHYNISLLTQGFFNKFLLLAFVILLSFDDYMLGIFSFILVGSILYVDPEAIQEGFVSAATNYYRYQ